MKARSAVIVDYGMGNLRSLGRALERAGATVTAATDARSIAQADRLVIPGQGAFPQAMARLRSLDLIEAIQARLASERPSLGICLGLQLLYQGSAEGPGIPGLGLIEGTVELLPLGSGRKRPHMGWAPVEHQSSHPVLAANPSGEAFYFVHSFAARSADGHQAATTVYDAPFIAAIARGTLVATQFHPEKSQDAGERLLGAWLAL